MKIAIYDMDKTVTRRATYTPFLLYMAYKRAPWRLLLLPALLFGFLLYGLKLWRRKELKQYMQRLFIGRRVKLDNLTPYLESHADWVVAHTIYPEVIARIAEEKAQGYRHVLATASYRLYVDAIAQRLGFDDVIATDLLVENGEVLAQIDGENCYDMAKLDKVIAWMHHNNIERSQCFIRSYSDHISDSPILGLADEAYATNPHPPLLDSAKAKGWQILDWRRISKVIS